MSKGILEIMLNNQAKADRARREERSIYAMEEAKSRALVKLLQGLKKTFPNMKDEDLIAAYQLLMEKVD